MIEEYAYVNGSNEPRLRYLLNKNEDISEIFKLLNVVLPSELQPHKQEIESLRNQIEIQELFFEDSIKYKYIIERISTQHKLKPIIRHLYVILDKLITAECKTYQVLLNHYLDKTDKVEKNKKKKKHYYDYSRHYTENETEV